MHIGRQHYCVLNVVTKRKNFISNLQNHLFSEADPESKSRLPTPEFSGYHAVNEYY